MKKLLNSLFLAVCTLTIISCNSDDDPVANSVTLQFNNTFENKTIVLGNETSTIATTHISAAGQVHHFSELKYVISNIRLVRGDGSEVPYHINDLDKGATVINQAKASSLNYVLTNIPVGEYKQLKFGLGVKPELNMLDQERFPKFYDEAGANDTKMMWEWGTGYRFTKIEGFYDADNKELSIHTGSTVEGTENDPSSYVQGVDAYRDIALNLPNNAVVGSNAPKINVKADFDKLLSGNNEITLSVESAITPTYHSGLDLMIKYVDNLKGMFSIESVEN